MDAEFSSEAQPMQQQMQQQMQEMYFEEEAPDESDSAAEDIATPVIFARLESEVLSVAFSPDGRKIIAGLENGSLQLFDTISGNRIGNPFQGHESSVKSVAFRPDGKAIVSGSDDKTLRLWDLQGKQIGNPFLGHENRVMSVAFSPDGKVIVSGSWDNTLGLWDLQGNQISNPSLGYEDLVTSVAFSPDGKVIVSGSGDGTMRLWDLQGNQIGNLFIGHRYWVNSVAFSPDGKVIVSGSYDGTMRLWDLQGNQIGNPFLGHVGHKYDFSSVAFSPDGKVIVSGSADRTLRLWDLQGNQIGNPFLGHEHNVRSVAFSPDSTAIVSGSYDNTIRLWTLDGNPIPNLADRSRQIEIPQGVANDSAQGEDCLNVQDEIEAMATVLMLRSLQPPMAVAILGSWGSGKSFGMYLIQQRIEAIRRQGLTRLQAWGDLNYPNDTQITSPYVGHIYQISFNAWTYAKSDLWASLMQEIFYELNRQITLERQIGIFLSSPQTTVSNFSATRNIDRLIYNPIKNLWRTIQTNIEHYIKVLDIFEKTILNLWIVQFILHIILFLLIPMLYVYQSVLLLDILIKEKFDLPSKLGNRPFVNRLIEQFRSDFNQLIRRIFRFSNLLVEKFRNYYRNYFFPDDLKTSYKSWSEGIESVIEHLLFLMLVGFPKRLKDSKKDLEKFKKAKILNLQKIPILKPIHTNRKSLSKPC